jgi:hypothetical protein
MMGKMEERRRCRLGTDGVSVQHEVAFQSRGGHRRSVLGRDGSCIKKNHSTSFLAGVWGRLKANYSTAPSTKLND